MGFTVSSNSNHFMISQTQPQFFNSDYLQVCGYPSLGKPCSFSFWSFQISSKDEKKWMGKGPFLHRLSSDSEGCGYCHFCAFGVSQELSVTFPTGPGRCPWGSNCPGSHPMPCHPHLPAFIIPFFSLMVHVLIVE